jgi:hypothetical protein
MTLAKGLEEEIYREVKQRENTSYSYGTNEMNMLAIAARVPLLIILVVVLAQHASFIMSSGGSSDGGQHGTG